MSLATIAILFTHLRHFQGAGAIEQMWWNLAQEFARRGIHVDLVTLDATGAEHLPAHTYIHHWPLSVSPALKSRLCAYKAAPPQWQGALWRPVLLPRKIDPALQRLPALSTYLEQRQPDALLSGGTQQNLCALLARAQAGGSTRLVISEHNPLSQELASSRRRRSWRWRYLKPLLQQAYPHAHKCVAVSQTLAADLATTLKLPASKLDVVYNPVVSPKLQEMAAAPLEHPWLQPEAAIPVVLHAGRLDAVKDQPTLLQAFALACRQQPLRLILLGQGSQYQRLKQLAQDLGISKQLHIVGHVTNPLAYMARAQAFVLTSHWEGFSNVLVEALACGCPVVATHCGGPEEILDQGKYGYLAPVGDAKAIAQGLLATVNNPPETACLQQRAQRFSVAAATKAYLDLLQNC